MTRKLATVRKISKIVPIEGADAIELVHVDGWQSVVKKGEYQEGDLVVYLEVDSWVPHELAPFLSKGKEPNEYNGIKGERLRTVKLRGVLSQGLIISYDCVSGYNPERDDLSYYLEGDDVTEDLGIQKWEAPISVQLAGRSKGNFPILIPKTDQERIQNIKKTSFLVDIWEVTEKLEGSSMTCYLIDGVFGVCSRNIDLERDESNSFWKVAIEQDIENKMRSTGMDNFAIQGELIGPGVQGNIYNLDKLDYYVYDVYSIKGNASCGFADCSYVEALTRYVFVNGVLNLKTVPIIKSVFEIKESIKKDDMLKFAEGESVLYKTEREGLVFKSRTDPNKSFKVISNKYLLGEK